VQSILENKCLGSFIDNNFVCDTKAKAFSCKSVVTGETWMKLYPITKIQAQRAIKSSYKCFNSLKKLSHYHRRDLLNKAADIIDLNKEIIARVITSEMGKTYKESIDEINYAANYLKWFSSEAISKSGYCTPSEKPNKRISVIYEPIGVCGIITPWNFPIAMAARKIAPAIAAGCTALVKPASETPITMLLVAEAFRKAGIAPGALQVLIGDEKIIGDSLIDSKHIKKISFTGSTKTGKILYQNLAKSLKVATMELGGNAPLIIANDAEIDTSVNETIKAKLRNLGQSCVAANRIFVQKNIKMLFLKKLKEKVKKLQTGNPFSKDVDLTNILHPKSIKKMQRHIDDALKKGAKIQLKGKSFAHPHILDNCTESMELFSEETFGPLFAIFEFETDSEAVKYANKSEYGLAAYVFTRDLKRAYFFAENLQCGMVGINDGEFSSHQLPFGGVKNSGFGREGGPFGIFEYLTEKAISTNL